MTELGGLVCLLLLATRARQTLGGENTKTLLSYFP